MEFWLRVLTFLFAFSCNFPTNLMSLQLNPLYHSLLSFSISFKNNCWKIQSVFFGPLSHTQTMYSVTGWWSGQSLSYHTRIFRSFPLFLFFLFQISLEKKVNWKTTAKLFVPSSFSYSTANCQLFLTSLADVHEIQGNFDCVWSWQYLNGIIENDSNQHVFYGVFWLHTVFSET